MFGLTFTKLPEIRDLKLLVAGEIVLDRYVSGEVERISPEAPIPVLRVSRREHRPGNAGFVVAGLRALGASPSILSIIGNDTNGALIRQLLTDMGADTSGLAVDPYRPTIVKERFLGSVQSANRATQQLLRVDEEHNWPLRADIEDDLVDRLPDELERVDGVLVSDINKGVLTPRLLRALIDGATQRGLPIVVDPRLSEDLSIYRRVTALTPNRYESERATGIRLTTPEAWHAAAQALIDRLDLQACLITLDRDGIYLLERNGAATHIPTSPRDVYDVTGAGDVVLTVFSFFAAGGLDFASAAALANLAAGLEVAHQGAEVVSREELGRSLMPSQVSFETKVLSHDELSRALELERSRGRRIAFTNGCFDLLHSGHLGVLSFARALGDVLVVGVNSDSSVRQRKGADRPIHHECDRCRLLAALGIVDYVVVFEETDAEPVIQRVRPDVLVKGSDYSGKRIDGQSFVESYGGQVAIAPLVNGHSTSGTIARVRSASPIAPSTREQE